MNLLTKLKPDPKNPRRITGERFERLKKSIMEFPEMLEKRPIVYDENFTILGGRQRFDALVELAKGGFEVKESYFQSAQGWTDEQKREFMVKDNHHDGEWDIDILRESWHDEPLGDWGLDFLGWDKDEVGGKNHIEGREEDGDLMIPEEDYQKSTTNTVVLVYNNQEYIEYMEIMKELIETAEFENPAVAVLEILKKYHENN